MRLYHEHQFKPTAPRLLNTECPHVFRAFVAAIDIIDPFCRVVGKVDPSLCAENPLAHLEGLAAEVLCAPRVSDLLWKNLSTTLYVSQI